MAKSKMSGEAITFMAQAISVIAMARAIVESGAVDQEKFIATLQRLRQELSDLGTHSDLLFLLDAATRAIRQKNWGMLLH